MNDASRTQQHLANQRTFLAWMRTSVALIGLGFVVSRFGLFLRTLNLGHGPSVTTQSSSYYSLSSLVGTIMVILGIVLVYLFVEMISYPLIVHCKLCTILHYGNLRTSENY